MAEEATTNESAGADTGQSVASNEQPSATTEPTSQQATDWRKELAGDNQEIAKHLERYKTPQDAAKAHLEAVKKIRTGGAKSATPPGEGATPEAWTQWRAENGLPADPSGYDTNLDNGLVIGDADKPVVDDFLKYAHKLHMKPADVKAAIGFMIERQGTAMAEMKAASDRASLEAATMLQEKYGKDGFQAMIESRKAYFDTLPESVRYALENAKMPDGTAIGANPDVFEWFQDHIVSSGFFDQMAPKGVAGGQSLGDAIADANKRFAAATSSSERNKIWTEINNLQNQKLAREGVKRK